MEAPWDSASQMADEQQFSVSAEMQAQLSSISLIQAVCQTSASLISTVQWVSMSQMVWAQRAFTSLMALVVSQLVLMEGHPKVGDLLPLLCINGRPGYQQATQGFVGLLLEPSHIQRGSFPARPQSFNWGAGRPGSPPGWDHPSPCPLEHSLDRRYPLVGQSPPA